MSKPIMGSDLHQWLIDSEIISKDQHVRRVVIDINVEDVVRIYIEEFGSDKMLTLAPPKLEGATVVILPTDKTEQDEQD